MDAETVVNLVSEKLVEIGKILDQFKDKDETTFINMSVCNNFTSTTLMSSKKCGSCNHAEPVLHAQKYTDR